MMPLTKISVKTAPRDSHVLITQRRERGKKCCDFESKVRTPKHLNIPHTVGRDPQFLGFKRQGKGGSHTPTSTAQGELLQLFWRSDTASCQHWIRQLLQARGQTPLLEHREATQEQVMG